MYRHAARGGPSHGHRKYAQQISRRSVQRFQRYARGQTDTQTDRQTNWSQYAASLPRRSNKEAENGYWAGVLLLLLLLLYIYHTSVASGINFYLQI